MLENIQLILTGGTIDSEYDPTQDTPVPFSRSHIKNYITKYIQPNFDIFERATTLVDSRDITDNMRQVIFDHIIDSKSDYIILTHGTYTMAETGRFLRDKIKTDKRAKNKRIVIVGSFYPLVGFSISDAPFNLGYAIGVIQHLTPDVYVAMNAQLFDPTHVDKNINKGKFISKK